MYFFPRPKLVMTRRNFLKRSLVVGGAAGTVVGGAAVALGADRPSHIPDGYELVYKQDFASDDAANDFVFTDPKAWKVHERAGRRCLDLHGKSKYKPPHRSPYNIALIGDVKVGDYVLEADMLQTGKEYGHRDMCLFYSFVDPAHFYYTHIASKTDKHAHNIFIVNDKPRTKISEKTTKGFKWGKDWHHVAIRRRIMDGLIEVYVDDMSTPIMVAHDKTHQRGHLGFGSFDDTGLVSNIKVWSPSAKRERVKPFKS